MSMSFLWHSGIVAEPDSRCEVHDQLSGVKIYPDSPGIGIFGKVLWVGGIFCLIVTLDTDATPGESLFLPLSLRHSDCQLVQ